MTDLNGFSVCWRVGARALWCQWDTFDTTSADDKERKDTSYDKRKVFHEKKEKNIKKFEKIILRGLNPTKVSMSDQSVVKEMDSFYKVDRYREDICSFYDKKDQKYHTLVMKYHRLLLEMFYWAFLVAEAGV